MNKIHLITTCTKQKNGEPGKTIFPGNCYDLNSAFIEWGKLVQERYSEGRDVKNVRELYKGQHWNTALNICSMSDRVCLWVVSAGLGLRHSSEPGVPYEASFSSIGKCSPDLWRLLCKAPVLPGQFTSLRSLFFAFPRDLFVVAASPSYLRAIEDDLADAALQLLEPRHQLRIASTASYKGRLKPYIDVANISMMQDLKANMTTLNINHAEVIVNSLL